MKGKSAAAKTHRFRVVPALLNNDSVLSSRDARASSDPFPFPSLVKRKKLITGLAVMLAVSLALDQGLQHFVIDDGYLQGHRIAPFDPPLFCESQVAWNDRLTSHLDEGEPLPVSFKLDAELGWCLPRGGPAKNATYDWSGSRIGFQPLPLMKTTGVTRVLTIGCSFTRGDEVANTETWAAVLDHDRNDLELANMGVGAYGIDQALLRMRRDGLRLDPDEVWLGIFPYAAPRTVTTYRPAARRWTGSPAFKPRFVLDELGELELIPNPATTLAAVARLLSDHEFFLEAAGQHDFRVSESPVCWLPNGSHAAHYSGFARLVLTAAETRRISPQELLRPADSECHRVMLAIVLQTRKEVEAHGARFRVLILPGRQDLISKASPEGAYWNTLALELRDAGVEVVDLADALIDAGAIEDDTLWAPQQHYSPAGNRIVADELTRVIKP